MSQPIVVRKYEIRRLYDTSSSRYVNLPENLTSLARLYGVTELVAAE